MSGELGGFFGSSATLEKLTDGSLRVSFNLPVNFKLPATGDVGAGMSFAFPDNTITGTIDGSNRSFTLTNPPLNNAAMIFSDNILVPPGQYTVVGTALTFIVGSVYIPMSELQAAYRY